jgi:threonyl-tRNA synthetase
MLPEYDHRRLGQELDLFHLQEEAPGAVFWHPRGLELIRNLESWVRRIVAHDGYREVRTPQLMSRSIWQSSGHWESFAAGMIHVDHDERAGALKPVNCPGHVQIAMRAQLSHRDLPLRLAENGVVHRNEASGVLHGLFRLRQFTQDDGHIFCAEEHVHAELVRFLARVQWVYRALGLSDFDVALSTRPPVRAGDDASWEKAEAALARAADVAGHALRIQPGEGAFYGPKIELSARDRAGRVWQCGTIQLDYFMPQRFGASYVAADGSRRPLVMLHRAMLGSFERFAAILLEHHAGRLPAWLAPEAARVLAVSEAQSAYASEVVRALASRTVRASSDARDGSLSWRIRDAHLARVPFVLVVGAREADARSVVLRSDDGAAVPLDVAVARIAECASPPDPAG